MGLKIDDHLFYGPFKIETAKVGANKIPVVFAIVGRSGKPWNPTFKLIDAGCSGADGLVFTEHPDAKTWVEKAEGEAQVYLLDTPVSEDFTEDRRRQIAEAARAKFAPPNDKIPIFGS